MSSGKNGREKPGLKLVIVIIVVVLSLFGINVSEYIPTDWTEPTTSQESEVNQNEKTESSQGSEATKPSQNGTAASDESELIVTMIECGQADSFLIQQGDMVALIDCGKVSTGDDVVAYLKSVGITKIDYLFGTHPHEDHMGGMYEVITNFEIGKIIIPNKEVTPGWFTKLMTEIKSGTYDSENPEKEVRYVLEYPEVGDVYELGEATIEVLGPIDLSSSNPNNWSTILMISLGDMDVLMTGDAETSVEKALIKAGTELDAEILKVGHHGSDTSSSDAFLDAVDPDYALISAGLGNNHDHPIKSTMEKLEEREIPVYRTDESGTVVVIITSDSIEFSVEPGDYLSGPELAEKEGE